MGNISQKKNYDQSKIQSQKKMRIKFALDMCDHKKKERMLREQGEESRYFEMNNDSIIEQNGKYTNMPPAVGKEKDNGEQKIQEQSADSVEVAKKKMTLKDKDNIISNEYGNGMGVQGNFLMHTNPLSHPSSKENFPSKSIWKTVAKTLYKHNSYRTKVFPETYKVENPMIYDGVPQERDTSDRTLAERAREAGFDALGFCNGMGLQREAFYTSPFLSCIACNTISFVSASSLRIGMVADHFRLNYAGAHGYQNSEVDPNFQGYSESTSIQREIIPPCIGCGRTDMYIFGSHDTNDKINSKKRN